ncbi:MAG: flagellar biosynthesis protein FliQ [Nitrospinota bacterium]
MVTADFVASFTANGLWMALLLSAPMLGFGLLVGLVVSIFQAVTSIQEMTLAFIPKILAVMASILIFFPWMVALMTNYTSNIIANIPYYIQ